MMITIIFIQTLLMMVAVTIGAVMTKKLDLMGGVTYADAVLLHVALVVIASALTAYCASVLSDESRSSEYNTED
jgi:Na+/pantothenate symporter